MLNAFDYVVEPVMSNNCCTSEYYSNREHTFNISYLLNGERSNTKFKCEAKNIKEAENCFHNYMKRNDAWDSYEILHIYIEKENK